MVPGCSNTAPFFIAISRAVVNHVDGDGTAPDPLVWSDGALPERRRLVHAVRDRAFLPGPAGIWDGEWIALAAAPVTAEDVGAWPYSVEMLVKLVAFWVRLGLTLGLGVYLVLKFSFCMNLGWRERVVLEKAVPPYRRPGRPISVSAVPFGPGTDIWRSRRFIGALFRALRAVPGGIGRFIPCDVGANHCRLQHIGWEKCGHGLTSRPRESASEGFLNKLLVLFRYPPRSAAALLVRYSASSVLCR